MVTWEVRGGSSLLLPRGTKNTMPLRFPTIPCHRIIPGSGSLRGMRGNPRTECRLQATSPLRHTNHQGLSASAASLHHLVAYDAERCGDLIEMLHELAVRRAAWRDMAVVPRCRRAGCGACVLGVDNPHQRGVRGQVAFTEVHSMSENSSCGQYAACITRPSVSFPT